MKVVISLIILGTAVLAVSIGFLILNEIQLDKYPANPVDQSLIAGKKNLEQTKDIGQAGILVGSIIVGTSATAAGWLYWRNR